MINNIPSNSAYHSSHTVVLHKRPDYHSFGLYVGEDVPSGVYVVTVAANSPAANSNIRPGDRVLAINDRLVSSVTNNPIEMIKQLSSNAQSLTLTVQPSNILQTLNIPLSNNLNNDNYHYLLSSKPSVGFDNDLESYIKSLFSNENLHIIPSSSGNNNEYILSPDTYSYQPHHHHHHKRRHRKMKQLASLPNDEQKENTEQLSPRRSIPSMGTPHVILRNSQSFSNKDNETQEAKPIPDSNRNSNRNFEMKSDNNTRQPTPTGHQLFIPSPVNPPHNQGPTHENTTNRQPTPTGHQSFIPSPVNPPHNQGTTHQNTTNREPTQSSFFPPQLNAPNNQANHYDSGANRQPPPQNYNRPSPMNSDGLREVHLHRAPPFKGFGFHLQYNQTYYVVQDITPNGPAQRAGLRPNDVMRKVNNQPMDKMPHSTLVQIIDSNQEVTLLVQDHEAFLRTNPQAPRHSIGQTMSNPSVSTSKNDGNKSENFFSRALSKISGR